MSHAGHSLRRGAVLLLFFFAVAGLATAEEDLASRVLVVHAGSGESKRVAEYYMKKRGIPRENRCEVRTGAQKPDTDLLYWDQYESKVAEPIRKCLTRVGKDRILYIVFSFKVPYRLWKVPPHHGVALDAYVADIWGETAGSTQSLNPYFDPAPPHVGNYAELVSLADYRAQPNAKHIYSVWRLDAATEELARGLVDKAMEGEKSGLSGQACIDRRMGAMDKVNAVGYGGGDWDLHRAAEELRAAGVTVVEDENEAEFGHPPAPERCDNAIFYAGWYSLNHYNDAFTWKPGAIGIHLDSASAADPRKGPNWSANAVMKGITVTSGAVDEPTLSGLPHPGGIVHDLLAGANVGDAFLRNTFWLRWMIVNIGDPLYRPKFIPAKKADETAPASSSNQPR
jgi:uncharacterized protein (TIGR03790 family)